MSKTNRISINGVEYVVGRNLTINGDRIIVDGKIVEMEPRKIMEVRVLEGTIEELRSDVSVYCGDVEGSVEAGTSVECGDVGGNVRAGVSINAHNIAGKAKAGVTINALTVGK